jgi:ankyrin repeat protein
LTRNQNILLAIFGSMALAVCVLLAPWVMIGIGFALEGVSKEGAHRNFVPKNLVEAAMFDLATPAMVTQFLDAGEKIDQMVDVGNGRKWPLIRAAATDGGNEEVVRLLLHRGAKIEEAGLWTCLNLGNESMARVLIEEGAPLTGAQPDADLDIGPEPIQAAVAGHQAWAVKFLLEKGANLHVRNRREDLLLNLSLENESMNGGPVSDSLETTQALLAAGADVDLPGMRGYTPLAWAGENGKLDEAKLLLAAGAKVDGPPDIPVTPLALAVRHCRPEVAALLLSKGASRAVKTEEGLSLREGACYAGYPDKSDQQKIADLLR